MRVRVLYFGQLKAPGREDVWCELTEHACVGDVVSLAREQGASAELLARCAVAVNSVYARASEALRDGDEVALLPPVSGGAADDDLLKPATGEAARTHVLLTRDRIDTAALQETVKSAAAGAVCVFDGIVRDNTRGRQTLFLDYEAYEEMALLQMEALVLEAHEKFSLSEVRMAHRLGKLEIGDTSVLIAVGSPHRAAAFEACRWLIDTLKRTVPIWKKEHFVDGAVWTDGEPFPESIALAVAPESQGL
jgi:molybdopterin synthase catalytic subunit/molybdopterin converting factor small subunit